MIDIRRTGMPLLLGGALMIAPLAFGLATAHAYETGTEMQQAAPQVDDATLDRFVDAFVAVRDIHEDYSAQLQTVTDEATAQELQQQAQAEMVDAVQGAGMSVDDYNAIGMMLQGDPDLLEEVQQRAEERL